MKPTVSQNTLQSHGIESSVKFGIKSSGLHHILGILRNQLYSDKVLAVIREYTCNGVDAHVAAGCKDKPIEVTLPTKLNLTFKVRDFGDALTDEEIQDVYAFYGESTKRNTNDQIGMLGIGSKSAFAYGDNFVINSFLDGKKHIYNAFIDPSQIGQISKIGVEETNEENGIEIVVPAREGDVDEFHRKAEKLFKWFTIRPIIKNAKFDYKDSEILFSGDNWEWRDVRGDRWNRDNSAMVVMGNIGYPVDSNDLELTYDDACTNLLTDNLVLKVPIGDVEISASRENLQFTDLTRKKLKQHLNKVAKDLSDTIGEQFSGCKTLFEAKCLYGSTFRTDSALYQLRDVIKKHLYFNGTLVDGSSFNTYNNSGVDLRQFKKTSRSQRYRPEETSTIFCEKDIVVIENDIGHRRGLMGKILPLIHNKEQKPYLLQFESYLETGANAQNKSAEQAKAKWLKDEGFDGEMIKLSSLPQHKLAEFGYTVGSSGSSYEANEKHTAKCFEYDFDFGKNGRRYHVKKSDYWKVVDLDVENESGVYVIIDKFCPENTASDTKYSNWDDPSRINRLKDELKGADIKLPKHVYAFKVKERGKIEGKKGWTNLYSWVQAQLKKVIKDANLDQAWIDTQKINELDNGSQDGGWRSRQSREMLDVFRKEIAKGVAIKNGTFAEFVRKHGEMRQTDKIRGKIGTVRSIAKDFGVDFKSPKGVKPTHDLKALLKKVQEKYSMLDLVSDWGHGWDSKRTEKLTNYINVIDVCNARETD